MRIRTITQLLAVAMTAILALLVAGCGGGGASGGGGGGALVSPVSLFLTDDLNTGYDGVWVNVKKVEMLTASGSTVVFEDATGHVANVRALNSGGTSRFLFLGDDHVPQGTYTGIRITLDKEVVLFPAGATTGQQRSFAGLDASNNKLLTLTFAAPKDTAIEDHFVIDFKLSDWTDDGALVQGATVVEGSKAGLDDPARHDEDNFKGAVSGLSGAAPNQTFTLDTESGNKLTVKTDSTTSVFNRDGSPNPALANGKSVQVRGQYKPADGSLLASSVRIKGSGSEDPHEIKGATSAPDESAGTFVVNVHEAEGFMPDANSIKVHVDPSTTRFTSHGGVVLTSAEFFAALVAHPGIRVEVEGTIGAGMNLEARSAKIDDASGDEGAEAKGTVASVNAGAGSFRFTLSEWGGFTGTNGASINVTTDSNTSYRDANGAEVNQTAFFAALSAGKKVEVRGAYSTGTIAATLLKLVDVSSGEDEARGSVLSVKVGFFMFDVSVTEWQGFSGSNGMTIHVDATTATNFRGMHGVSMTRDQFFAAVAAGATVEVKGTLNAGTSILTAVRVKLED